MVDLRYPADVEFTENGDSYYYKFRISESGKYGITTEGSLDSVLTLYDSSHTVLAKNDDGWQLGNTTNALILADLSVDSAATDPGLYYLQVQFPYNTVRRTEEEDSNVPLEIVRVTEGGSTSDTASTVLVGHTWVQRTYIYFDSDTTQPAYGNLSAVGEVDYWKFNITSWMTGSNAYVLVRGVGAEDSGLTVELVDQDDLYSRSGPLTTGSNEEYTEGDLAVVTIAGKIPKGDHVLKVSSSNAANAGGIYSLTVANDRELDTLEFEGTLNYTTCDDSRPEDVDDMFFPCQWHLAKNAQADIKVQEAWEAGHTGEGIEVAVADSGIDILHPDLSPNLDLEKNLNVVTGANDPSDPFDPVYMHGNGVAGIIAAAPNAHGIRGIAYNATLYNINVLAEFSYAAEDAALGRSIDTRAVSNHSYGFPDNGSLWPTYPTWNELMDTMVKTGYGGLGVSHVRAAGNGGSPGEYGSVEDEYTDYESLNSHIGTIPACAVGQDGLYISDISENGNNLWVCGPSYAQYQEGMFTTSMYGRYRTAFGGTSAAAPAVAGVAALVRGANTELSYRDVKFILAGSARQVDSSDDGWVNNSADKYGTDGTYSYSPKYGFGLVDAEAAVNLATSDWTLLPDLKVADECESNPVLHTRELGVNGWTTTPPYVDYHGYFKRDNLEISNSGIEFAEYVEFYFDFDIAQHGPVQLYVGGPSSVPGGSDQWVELLRRSFLDSGGRDGVFRFAVNQFVGLPADGTWRIALKNHSAFSKLYLHSWGIRVYGHGPTSAAATGTGGSEVVDYTSLTPCSRAAVDAAEGRVVTLSTTSLEVSEGSTGEYTVVLGAEPSGTVTVTVGGTTGTDVSVNDDSLEFTATTWETAQTVTVSAASDTDVVNDTVTLTHTASGGGYDRVSVDSVTVTVVDDGDEDTDDTDTDDEDTDEDEDEDTDDDADTCVSDRTTLCLQDNRFQVQVGFRLDDGPSGFWQMAAVEESTEGSGVFSFNDSDDWTFLTKVLDGCSITNGMWVMHSVNRQDPNTLDTTSDAGVNRALPAWTVIYTDTETGETLNYSHGIGVAASERALPDRATINRSAFTSACAESESLPAKASGMFGGMPNVVAEASTDGCGNGRDVCLQDNRFKVTVDWKDWGAEGRDRRRASQALGSSEDAAAFGFHGSEVIDAMVKVTDQCSVANEDSRYYVVQVSAATLYGFQARVEDLRAGASGDIRYYRWWEEEGMGSPPKTVIPPNDATVTKVSRKTGLGSDPIVAAYRFSCSL